jgi:hypothetical protein
MFCATLRSPLTLAIKLPSKPSAWPFVTVECTFRQKAQTTLSRLLVGSARSIALVCLAIERDVVREIVFQMFTKVVPQVVV